LKRRINWLSRFAVCGALLLVALAPGIRGWAGLGGRLGATRAADAATLVRAPAPLAVGDADRDGLPDAREAELAARFAPAVILDPGERNRPASIEWLLARIPPARPVVGAGKGLLAGRLETGPGSFSDEVRAGSAEPRDWVTYVHVYPRVDGGINVQYWFFYPYNDGPLFFDHESDWEHVTVDVAPSGRPRAVYFAQHGNNSPGVPRAWADVRKIGDHPMVLSARGTHASYPNQASLAWFEHASRCDAPEPCADPIWRTWEAGGLVNMGERGAVLGAREALAYEGRWGGQGRFLRSRPAPHGPLQQGGFWSGGFN
jgi:hypothetical protein